ncbi:isopenicillin N synthase family oxygenase, partial [Gammaproteobacteria bacterium]|nr:isopenicillin N synthase family oxygenase [Gammaproteobacteria bacterium]
MSFNTIPAFSMPDIEQRDVETIAELKLALTTHGFFTITDHGIADEVLQSSYRLSREFFSLPDGVKNTYAHPENAGARGYTPYGKETAVGETTPDLKEFWHHGPMIDDSYDHRISKNILVSEISDFNDQFDLLFNQLNMLGLKVLSAIAVILGKESSFFDSWALKGNSILRLIHYPPVVDSSNILRARAHEDINLITLLVGAEESGLEVQNPEGDWIPIAA